MLTTVYPSLRRPARSYCKSHGYLSRFVPYSAFLIYSNFIVQIISPQANNPSWALSKVRFAVFANSPSVTHSSIGRRSKTFLFGSQTGTGMFLHLPSSNPNCSGRESKFWVWLSKKTLVRHRAALSTLSSGKKDPRQHDRYSTVLILANCITDAACLVNLYNVAYLPELARNGPTVHFGAQYIVCDWWAYQFAV